MERWHTSVTFISQCFCRRFSSVIKCIYGTFHILRQSPYNGKNWESNAYRCRASQIICKFTASHNRSNPGIQAFSIFSNFSLPAYCLACTYIFRWTLYPWSQPQGFENCSSTFPRAPSWSEYRECASFAPKLPNIVGFSSEIRWREIVRRLKRDVQRWPSELLYPEVWMRYKVGNNFLFSREIILTLHSCVRHHYYYSESQNS